MWHASPPSAELTFPGRAEAISRASAFVRRAAETAGIAPARIEALVPAVERVCAAVVERAYAPDELGNITLRTELTPAAWVLAIREHGLPLDASVESRPAAPGRSNRAWHDVHEVVDEVHWTSLGKDGTELALVVRRPQPDVTDHLPESKLIREPADAPRAPEQRYAIRRMRPEEAISVAQCVYRAYGYSYPNEDLYYPERIAHLNATGELVSAVAVDEGGQVVGHLALERPGLGPFAESGQAVVLPAHRGRHLLQRMRRFLEDEGRRLGLVHIWAQAVTTHTFSQRVEGEMGSRLCGVSLGDAPASLTFKAIADAAGAGAGEQRGSCMVYVKFLVPPAGVVVHAPARHREMLARIYGQLDCPVRFAAGAPAADGPGRLSVSLDRGWGRAVIRAPTVGADSAAEIRQALDDLVEVAGAEAVYLELPLAQAGTPALCAASEAMGFFFSGVAPCFAADGDVLRLQHLSVPLDPARLRVASPFGAELVGYAARERARVAAG